MSVVTGFCHSVSGLDFAVVFILLNSLKPEKFWVSQRSKVLDLSQTFMLLNM